MLHVAFVNLAVTFQQLAIIETKWKAWALVLGQTFVSEKIAAENIGLRYFSSIVASLYLRLHDGCVIGWQAPRF
jgi:hypothetical protein